LSTERFPTVNDPVRLFLLRHAHAVSEEEDPARPLSERGREQVRSLTNFLEPRGGLKVERVWHSPLLRARDTADLFCEHLGIRATRREIDGLLPFDDVRGIARRLSGFGYPLLVVGHDPHLGRLVSMLVCGNTDQEVVDFKKGALLCLEREATKSQVVLWRIRWLITPGLLDESDRAEG
jgi:phosphohistidine phosphatase